MEATLHMPTFAQNADLLSAKFHADLEAQANESLMTLVNSVLNKRRWELLKSVPGEMSNPLVGQREVQAQ